MRIDAPFRLAYRVAHLAQRAWWLARRPETHGALVALWHRDRVLLVRSSYRRAVSLPGGFVERGERAIDAAARELREELSLEIATADLRRAWHGSITFEHRTDTLDVFETDLQAPFDPRVDRREIVWAGWRTPDEARALELVPHVRAYLDARHPR